MIVGFIRFPGLVGFLIKSPPTNKVLSCGDWLDMLNPGKGRRCGEIAIILGGAGRYTDFDPFRLSVGNNIETVMGCIMFVKSRNLATRDFQVIVGES